MTIITEARFFGDYGDSFSSTSLHYQTMPIGDSNASYGSNMDPFGGTGGPLQNVGVGSFGRFSGFSQRFFRRRGGKRENTKKDDKSEKRDRDWARRKEDEPDSIPGMDKAESDLFEANELSDELMKKKRAERLFIDKLSLSTFQHLRSDAKRESKSLQQNPWAMEKENKDNEKEASENEKEENENEKDSNENATTEGGIKE